MSDSSLSSPPTPVKLVDGLGRTIAFGGGGPLPLIAGPCIIESEEHIHWLAQRISSIAGP